MLGNKTSALTALVEPDAATLRVSERSSIAVASERALPPLSELTDTARSGSLHLTQRRDRRSDKSMDGRGEFSWTTIG